MGQVRDCLGLFGEDRTKRLYAGEFGRCFPGHYTVDDVPPKPLARTTACAAASRAIGTRNGEQDT